VSTEQIPAEAPFAFTDAEWREYQDLPDQGISHRRWLEHVVNTHLATHHPARVLPSAEDVAREIDAEAVSYRTAQPDGPNAVVIARRILALFAAAPTVQEVRAEALREAADVLAAGGDPEPGAIPQHSGLYADWLRERAAWAEGE